MNAQRRAVSARKSCFLQTQNDLHYSFYCLFVNREAAVSQRGRRVQGGEEDTEEWENRGGAVGGGEEEEEGKKKTKRHPSR